MVINGTDNWISFQERRPHIGQKIIVHTFSDLVMNAVVTHELNLQDSCDAWKPINSNIY